MSEETKNTAELSDKQLEKVAGGKGGELNSFLVINPNGANIYLNPDKGARLGNYHYSRLLDSCSLRGSWVYVPGQYGKKSGYVVKSDLEKMS